MTTYVVPTGRSTAKNLPEHVHVRIKEIEVDGKRQLPTFSGTVEVTYHNQAGEFLSIDALKQAMNLYRQKVVLEKIEAKKQYHHIEEKIDRFPTMVMVHQRGALISLIEQKKQYEQRYKNCQEIDEGLFNLCKYASFRNWTQTGDLV